VSASGPAAGPLTPVARGILWVVAAMALGTAIDVVLKFLGGRLDAGQFVFLRSVAQLVLVAPLVLRRGWTHAAPRRPLGHLLRGVLVLAAGVCLYEALARLPLAEATVVFFTETLWAMAFAALILRERLTRVGIAAALLGFAGVLVVMRPGLAPLGAGWVEGALFAVGSAMFFALSDVVVKRLAATETSLSLLASAATIGLVATAPFAAASWKAPTPAEASGIVAVAAMGLALQACMIRGFRSADAAAVAPGIYAALPFGIAAGIVVFGERPDAFTWIGAAVVVAAVVLAGRDRR